MHKNIVLFSDGTGNSSGKLFKTNVWRVYQAVDLTDPQAPAEPRQFAFYDNGVGTSSFKPLAALGGALGVGLARNVRDLYAFVCRTYQPGDKIYAFGFSRGAFTIRVLVGLMMNQGLVPYDGNEADLKRNVASAFREYRKQRYKTTGGLVGPLRALRDLLINACRRLLRQPLYRDIRKIGAPGSKAELEIEFLGLWDTVDAYGLPVDELTRVIDRFIWPLTMRDLNLSIRVKRARHALAIDDERNTFHPRLWNEEPKDPQDKHPGVGVPGGNRQTTHIDQERISQVWFAGVHSNVGGGYPDDSLSHVSLEWIMTEAEKYGIRFNQKVWDGFRALADESGPIYDSRHGLAGYYRYNPRRIEKLTSTREVTVPRCKVHESVLRRIKTGQDGYAPFVLPPGFAVMGINGVITDGAQCLQTDIGDKSKWAKQREHAWNWVWWRRVAYFGTLFATLALIAMPLLRLEPPLSKGACSSQVCFVSDLIDSLAAVLPGFTATWTDSFSSYPHVFLMLASLIAIGLYAGGVFESRIKDAIRPVWYGIPKTSPRNVSSPPAPSITNRAIEWLRTRKLYQCFFWFLSRGLLPAAFLIGVGFAAVAAVSQVTFAIRDSWGRFCPSVGDSDLQEVLSRADGRPFRTSVLCTSTGLKVERGATYRLYITIPAGAPWTDNGIPAGAEGVPAHEVTAYMSVGVLFRRHLGQPWLKPMAKIGATGRDQYPLDPDPAIVSETFPRKRSTETWIDACTKRKPFPDARRQDKTFTSEIVARSSGELFIYLNDAIFLPTQTSLFYCNNEGTGRITVERVVPPPL